MSGARPYEDMPRSVIRELMRAGDTQVPHPPADATRLVHACWQVAVICMLDEVEDRPGLREVGSQLLAIRDLPHLHDVISGVDPSSIGGPVPKQELQPWSRGAIVVRQALAGASRFSHGRSQGRSGASNHSRGSERSRSSLRLPTLQEDAEYSLCAGAGLVQRAALAAIAPSPARGGGTLSI